MNIDVVVTVSGRTAMRHQCACEFVCTRNMCVAACVYVCACVYVSCPETTIESNLFPTERESLIYMTHQKMLEGF